VLVKKIEAYIKVQESCSKVFAKAVYVLMSNFQSVLHETLLIDEITLHHSISCAGNTWQCVAPLESLTWYNGLSAVCCQANSKMVLAADHLFSW